ncbi:exosome non-catalytic core subunit RRP43 ASCRUDRAFT_35671 [Ascoidea rubescens DSM 1968]|uniref:Uncharacterized protein n=1 Tax=Ascoidea rubescens DSM 1968 TaxID=1344418 RepID=A0A1D2VFX5_9ASCO|nr:hypothetical protein ASCRUDRAFT_35671 [Ascoidea rubescens DSM 1968]ODV60584.1 hypothetical protein ASCRUDRAFT_35671 [Ascoidea rubescens DSM 1968]
MSAAKIDSAQVNNQGDDEVFELKPMNFNPYVLQRIAPDLLLKKYLDLNIRPSLRSFNEFKSIQINDSNLQDNQNLLAKTTVKNGNTIVICGIFAKITEQSLTSDSSILESSQLYNEIYENDPSNQNQNTNSEFMPIYPIIEIARGRFGAPTDEEMILAKKLYNLILNSRLIPKSSLKINLGIKFTDPITNKETTYYSNADDEKNLENKEFNLNDFKPKNNFNFNLHATFKIFNREGPLFDIIYSTLLKTLQNVHLPNVYIDEQNAYLSNILNNSAHSNINTSRNKNKNNLIEDDLSLICDDSNTYPLILNQSIIGFSSTFGFIDRIKSEPHNENNISPNDNDDKETVLLCDIEGEAEETECYSRVNIIPINNQNDSDDNDEFTYFSITGGGSKITKQLLRKAVWLSKQRSKYLQSL